VRTVNEIPFAKRPRIVKPHGSLPAHEPFIFTEEEYRTYPARFSPFVNLVQQSMMETIFCLLGFSGDDPNFLHWSGWVRDNLGTGAPRIYLVGWLDLSVHRRPMLESRNVMPVDLSALPNADRWPRDLRHRYATDWFITALEQGKPYGAGLWPSSPPASPPIPPHLGIVPVSEEPRPQEEPSPPRPDQPAAAHEQALRALIPIWKANRRLYPGWLIAPDHVRQRLVHLLTIWNREFVHVGRLSPYEQLNALIELAWRMERALLPFPAAQEVAAYAALDSIDWIARTVGGEVPPQNSDWYELIKGADALALALARNARHRGDRAQFDRALQFVRARGEHDSTLRNAITYDECLWSLAAGDLKGLKTRLDNWLIDHTDTLWNLRKASLLAEMRDNAAACSLLEGTLIQIRRARRRDIDDLISLSGELGTLFGASLLGRQL
jgi:hypothetical protein